jgi:manganese/zinc/iron transport system substrate-binding protein
MDVSLWSRVAGAVGDELARFDPAHAEEYQTATAELQTKLEQLHAYGVRVIDCIPSAKKVLVTSHDAFRYFGSAYGIEVQAVQGISTESEAGLSRINELVDLLVSRKISAVFVESSVPKESIEALLRGAASRGQKVEIGGSLFSDAMGREGTYEGTYVGMMDHNLSTIARALGCPEVPANGFRGSQPESEKRSQLESGP